MREIKFRAWDKKNCEFITGCILFENSGKFAIEEEGLDWSFDWDVDVVLMQYTGLKDKNGVEIYEGDIVREGDLTGEIIFDTVRSAYCYTHLCGRAFLYAFAGEVIGNMHENPELLNRQEKAPA